MILEAQKSAGEEGIIFFIGGYLRAMFELDSYRWESELDKLAKDNELKSKIAELTWRSGMSDRAALRVLNLAKEGIIKASDFHVFGWGSVIADLSEDVLQLWVEFLLDSDEETAVSIALDLFYFYYLRKESPYNIPKYLTLSLLTHKSLFTTQLNMVRNQMDEFHWEGIGKRFVEAYPEDSIALASVMLEHFGEDGTIIDNYHSKTLDVLNQITKKHPDDIWGLVEKYLGPPFDSRAFDIRQWLRREAITLIPATKLWEWVDKDVDNRAWYLATFVPKVLFHSDDTICYARELLVRYGDREDVRRNLMANFSTEGWSRPASAHYKGKKASLLKFREEEDNDNVKRWIDEYVSDIEINIEYEKAREERRGY